MTDQDEGEKEGEEGGERDRDTGRKSRNGMDGVRGARSPGEGGSPEIPICAAPNETSAGERRMGY